MRAIELLNGLELPQPGGASDGAAAKKLLVKADEKTKAFVDQYTADRGDNRATDEEHRDTTGKEAIASFVETLRRPDVLSLFPDAGAAPGARQGGVAAHLKDLPPEDLPEEHRSSVLGEIDKFRQASAAREDEKRRREQIMERERLAGPSSSSPAYPSGPSGMRDPRDPQSYNHGAPSFVRPNGAAAPAPPPIRREDMDPEAADAEEEQRRISSKHRDEARRAEAASSAYENQERARLNHWTRILDESNAEAARKARAADGLAHRLSNWDEEEERSREIFYADRRRWRQHRALALRREMEDDAADERREVAEEEKRRQDEEKARVRREEEEKKMREEQRKAGVLLGEHAPLKLKSHVNEAGGAGGAAAAAAAAPVAAFSSADDGGAESSRARKNMAGILDDVPATNGNADASERRAAVRAALEEVDSTDLFSGNGPSTTHILWPHLSQPALSSYVAKLVEEMVGEAVPELQEVVVEKVAQCKGEDAGLAKSIEDTVQPVLAEEAGIFTEKLWRWLVEETQAAAS